MSEKERGKGIEAQLPCHLAPVLMVLLDDGERIVAINSLVETVTGWKERMILGKTFSDIFLPSARKETRWSPMNPSNPDLKLPLETRFKNRWGAEKTILWTGRLLPDESRAPRFLLAGKRRL